MREGKYLTGNTEDLVRLEAREGFAWVRINRPDKRNAMNQAARDALRDALTKARGQFPVLALTGTGKSFCGGIDLKEVEAEALQGSQAALSDWRNLNAEIREHPAVFIAAVNGIALGGGVTLTGVCDLAIASEEAEFGLPEVGFGMYPNPAGPAAQLSLPRKRAAWMVLTAERIDAQQAVDWALVNESVPASELEPRVEAIARRMAQFDAAALRECKAVLDEIPMRIGGWREAFEVGVAANTAIKASGDPAAAALARFKRGERNTGQG